MGANKGVYRASDFRRIAYHWFPYKKTGRYITEVVGLDSEAHPDGSPFMFCTSMEDTFTSKNIPDIFFTRRYRNQHFVVWNLKYESGALLYRLPKRKLTELRELLKCEHDGYKYFYIPHKHLRISRGRNAVKIWDMFPFYKSSLDAAARRYLGASKDDIDPTLFTPEYVKDNWDKIKRYCIQDSILTRDLALLLFKKLDAFGAHPTALYSAATVAFRFCSDRVGVQDVLYWWKHKRELLYYAFRSYAGGKFEVTARGAFKGYEYDVSSAYPHEIGQLKDLRKSVEWKSTRWEKKATYGFLKVFIRIRDDTPHPVAFQREMPTIYPIGSFNAYITKAEYEYLRDINVDVKIHDAWWIRTQSARCPYHKVVMHLYDVKQKYKKSDVMLSHTAKRMLNSLYGKFAQLIEEPDGKIRAGISWNPIYASVITANMRIKMSMGQYLYKDKCLAVHTDSLITTVPIRSKEIGDDIGQLGLSEQGTGLVIACGMYDIGNKSAWRSIQLPEKETWRELLSTMGDRTRVQISESRPVSWVVAMLHNDPEEINRFSRSSKWLDLNVDSKRRWVYKATPKRLLSGLEYSLPPMVLEQLKLQ